MGGRFLRCHHCQQASSIPVKEGSCWVVLGPHETCVVLLNDLNLGLLKLRVPSGQVGDLRVWREAAALCCQFGSPDLGLLKIVG